MALLVKTSWQGVNRLCRAYGRVLRDVRVNATGGALTSPGEAMDWRQLWRGLTYLSRAVVYERGEQYAWKHPAGRDILSGLSTCRRFVTQLTAKMQMVTSISSLEGIDGAAVQGAGPLTRV